MKHLPLLEKFIHEVINEAMIEMAKQPHEAEASGFALSIWKAGNMAYFSLYQPGALKELCQEMMKQPQHLSLDAKLDAVLYMHNNPVVAYIRMKRDDCGWIIENSVAEKGYGPMMYDIALSYAGRIGVVPDRDSVSPAARSIWKYYITKRKGDVRIYPLAQDDECAVYQYDDDSWFLDVKYILRNPDLGNVKNLTAKGDQTFQEIHQTTQLQPDEILRRLSSFYFDQKYHS